MLTVRSLLLTSCAVLCLGAASASADDLFIVNGAELTTPEGWGLYEQGEVSVLFREEGRARVEVVRVRRLPAADAKAIAELLKGRKGIADVQVAKAAVWEHNGLKGTQADATAKDGDAAVRIRLAALPAVLS